MGKMGVLRKTVTEEVACGHQKQVTEIGKWMHQHDSRSIANLESGRTESRSQATTRRRDLTSDLDLKDKERMKQQNLENKIAQLQSPEDQIMHKAGVQFRECKYLFDNNSEQ